jgi:hypothetical protein
MHAVCPSITTCIGSFEPYEIIESIVDRVYSIALRCFAWIGEMIDGIGNFIDNRVSDADMLFSAFEGMGGRTDNSQIHQTIRNLEAYQQLIATVRSTHVLGTPLTLPRSHFLANESLGQLLSNVDRFYVEAFCQLGSSRGDRTNFLRMADNILYEINLAITFQRELIGVNFFYRFFLRLASVTPRSEPVSDISRITPPAQPLELNFPWTVPYRRIQKIAFYELPTVETEFVKSMTDLGRQTESELTAAATSAGEEVDKRAIALAVRSVQFKAIGAYLDGVFAKQEKAIESHLNAVRLQVRDSLKSEEGEFQRIWVNAIKIDLLTRQFSEILTSDDSFSSWVDPVLFEILLLPTYVASHPVVQTDMKAYKAAVTDAEKESIKKAIKANRASYHVMNAATFEKLAQKCCPTCRHPIQNPPQVVIDVDFQSEILHTLIQELNIQSPLFKSTP